MNLRNITGKKKVLKHLRKRLIFAVEIECD